MFFICVCVCVHHHHHKVCPPLRNPQSASYFVLDETSSHFVCTSSMHTHSGAGIQQAHNSRARTHKAYSSLLCKLCLVKLKHPFDRPLSPFSIIIFNVRNIQTKYMRVCRGGLLNAGGCPHIECTQHIFLFHFYYSCAAVIFFSIISSDCS